MRRCRCPEDGDGGIPGEIKASVRSPAGRGAVVRRLRAAALTTASAEMTRRNGFSAGATLEGEFPNVTCSYAGKGIVRHVW